MNNKTTAPLITLQSRPGGPVKDVWATAGVFVSARVKGTLK